MTFRPQWHDLAAQRALAREHVATVHYRDCHRADRYELLPAIENEAILLSVPSLPIVVLRQAAVGLPRDERHTHVPTHAGETRTARRRVTQPERGLRAAAR